MDVQLRYVSLGKDTPDNALERWWEKQPVADNSDERGPWRISNAYWALSCPKRLVYEALGFPKRPREHKSSLLLDMGTWMEGRVLGDLSQAGVDVRSRQSKVFVTLERGLLLSGSIDWAGTVNGVEIYWDVKCMGGWKASKCNPRSRDYQAPLPEACQVNLYAYLDGVPRAGILAVSRDTVDKWPVVWETNSQLGEACVAGFQDAWDQVTEGVDVESLERGFEPHESRELPWECGYCPFVETCWPTAKRIGSKWNKFRV